LIEMKERGGDQSTRCSAGVQAMLGHVIMSEQQTDTGLTCIFKHVQAHGDASKYTASRRKEKGKDSANETREEGKRDKESYTRMDWKLYKIASGSTQKRKSRRHQDHVRYSTTGLRYL
jgi:hypothetical protein